MTISTLTNRIDYAGNGVSTAFAIPFQFINDEDLVVISVNDTTGVETTLTLTTNYTVAGGAATGGQADTGTLTMLVAPATGTTLVIYNNPALTQEVDLVENDSSPAETNERAYDKLTLIAQRLSDRVDRSIRFSEGYSGDASVELPEPVADRALGWNSDGDGLTNIATAPGEISISAYGETLVESTDAEDARTTLGFTGTGGTIQAGDIEAEAITTAKIDDEAVTLAKLAYGANKANYTPKSTSTALVVTETIIVAEGGTTQTLPLAATYPGKVFFLSREGGALFSAANFTRSGSDSIGGSSTVSLYTDGEIIGVVSDGVSTWKKFLHNAKTEWTAYTPTISWVSNAVASAYWRRDGQTLFVTGQISLSGAPTSAVLTWSVPSGLTINSTLDWGDGESGVLGRATLVDAGTARYNGSLYYNGTTSVAFRVVKADGTYGLDDEVNATVPFTFANGDKVFMRFNVPITNWKG